MSNESKPQEWFYLQNDTWNGPFKTSGLKELVKNGEVNPNTLLKIEIAGVPIKAHQVKSLFAEKPALCSEGSSQQVAATWPCHGSPAIAEVAPCPMCPSSNSNKVSRTWYSSMIGPDLFDHVKCENCGATYNGKTGKSDTVPVTIYLIVPLVFVLAFIIIYIIVPLFCALARILRIILP